MRMMVATWWMICSLKSCAQGRGGRGSQRPGSHPAPRSAPRRPPRPPGPPGRCSPAPRGRREPGQGQGVAVPPPAAAHLALDVGGDAEEQGPVEGELDHVVPVLGGQHALRGKSRAGGILRVPQGVSIPFRRHQSDPRVSRGPFRTPRRANPLPTNPHGRQRRCASPERPPLRPGGSGSRLRSPGQPPRREGPAQGRVLTWMGYPFHTSRRS